MPSTHGSPPADRTPRRWLLLTAALSAVVLTYTAVYQIYDTNFYVLWEATALLAGDHPYRDFFEWGVPLQAVVSAAAQWLVGYRLIGEFALHWIAIVTGLVLAFDIGYRLSRSLAASVAVSVCTFALLSVTPTFHYPKLLFYPLAIRLTWWYLDRPGVGRSIALGALVAVAFLFRHDHGLYIGVLTALTMLVARLARTGTRSLTGLAREAAAGLAMVLALLGPWAAFVHVNEGLPDYVRYRQELFVAFSVGDRSPFWSLVETDIPSSLATERPEPAPGVISFEWGDDSVDDAPELERRLGLQPAGPQGPDGHRSYQVANVHDPRLLALDGRVGNSEGVDWRQLRRAQRRLPSVSDSQRSLLVISLLLPLLLLGSSAAAAIGHWRRGEPLPATVWRMALFAVFLIVIESNLFREPSYVVIVAPLTAAIGTTFLAWPLRHRWSAPSRPIAAALWARSGVALLVLLLTARAAIGYSYGSAIYTPLDFDEHFDGTLEQLVVSPPIDGAVPREAALAYDQQPIEGAVLMRFLYDCTAPGDRLFVTGSTPYHVGYYANRPIAGGQLFWHHHWRTDPGAQRQQLALLQRQSVPFAVSTADPVFTDLANYPLVLDYMKQHYAEVPGTAGLLLVDRRRTPARAWGALGLPCFR